MVSVIPYKYEEPVTGILGVGTGLVITELPAEYAARMGGLAGWYKFAAKALVKIAISAVALLLAGRSGGLKSLFAKIVGWVGVGSIIPDAIMAAYPGGIPGIAERLAVMGRVYKTGTKNVADRMAEINRRAMAGATNIPSSEIVSTPGKFA